MKKDESFRNTAINGSITDQNQLDEYESLDSAGVQVDTQYFDKSNTEAYESLKKLRTSRVDQKIVQQVTESCFQHIEQRNLHGLKKEIEKNPAVSIVDIIDHRGYTLLHMACFKNLEEIGQMLMQRALDTVTEKQVHVWVNFKTKDDGFAPIHFASFRGNITLIQLLLKNGADMK